MRVRVFHADSDNSASTKENVLHDNCDEWIAPEGAVDNDAKIILHLGCSKKITSFQIWNMKSEKWRSDTKNPLIQFLYISSSWV